MTDEFRGTGITTKQMQDAPKGSVFIWCNQHTRYPKTIARTLGREDLKIYGPGILEHDAIRLRGQEVPAIIVDHAANLTENQRIGLDYMTLLIRAKNRENAGR